MHIAVAGTMTTQAIEAALLAAATGGAPAEKAGSNVPIPYDSPQAQSLRDSIAVKQQASGAWPFGGPPMEPNWMSACSPTLGQPALSAPEQRFLNQHCP